MAEANVSWISFPAPPSGTIPAASSPSATYSSVIPPVTSGRRPFSAPSSTPSQSTFSAVFVRRWSMEVTFAEVRRHLGVETQRQWSDPAIARTTPVLLGLFSLITLWAHDLAANRPPTARPAS